MTKTCFILDELYPEDRGGIARLMHNIIQHAKAADDKQNIHVVLARKQPKDTGLAAHFKGIATLHYLRPDLLVAERFGLANLRVNAVFKKQEAPFLRELRVLDAVLEAARSCGGFDHIEIPDHLGLGAMVLQAKRAGYGFQNTEITCRIHSALSVIIEAEPFYHPKSDWLAPRLELERYALQNADRVVAHLPTIARYNQRHFGFGAGWMDKVEIAFPPVIWPVPETAKAITQASDFIFTARFQPFKRPALFIKAAIALLESGSDFSGNFRMISYGFDPDYIDYLRLLVPARYRNRIRIETNVSPEARLAAISSGIIVQPSKYESLCALAYEASAEHRPLLLAKDCLAFGDDPHWVDTENCLLFDPDPASLAAAMEKARVWRPNKAADTTPDPSYFTSPSQPARRRAAIPVGLLIGPVHEADGMADMVAALAPLAPFVTGIRFFGTVAPKAMPDGLDYHLLADSAFHGQQWRALAEGLEAEAVILCAATALPHASFAVHGAQVVRPGVAYSSQSKLAGSRQMIIYPGKSKTINATEPRLCPPCIMLHRDDLDLIDTADDHALFPRLIARLARSKHELVLSPVANLREAGYDDTAPDQRLSGFEGENPWQDGLRWIGVEPKTATRNGLLASLPVALTLHGEVDRICTAEQPLTFEAGPPTAYALIAGAPVENHVLALAARHMAGNGNITVSLHQAEPEAALARHFEGRNCRVLKPGQAYKMRWGPLWQAGALSLVVSAEKSAKLNLANPLLISIA